MPISYEKDSQLTVQKMRQGVANFKWNVAANEQKFLL